MIPLSSLLSTPHSLFALPLLCHFSCLPSPSSLDPTLPLQLLSSIISPVDIHVLPTSLPFSFPLTPPLPLPRCLSGQSVTTLLLSSCSCGPSPIIDHFDCDTDHFCLFPIPPPSHPEGKLSHYVPQLKRKRQKLQRRGRVERKDGWRNSRNKGIWTDRGRERRVINERERVGEAKEEQRHGCLWERG